MATYMLEGAAEDWWIGTQAGLISRGEAIKWEVFVGVFYQRYFSAAAREGKESEFFNLR